MPKRLDRKWIRIAIYYAIALGLSFLTRVYWASTDQVENGLGLWGLLRHLLDGIGPFVGAVAIWAAFRPERRMSFGGTFPVMGIVMLAVPAIVLGVTGVANGLGLDKHLYGAEIGLWIALYAILEETGWRGYLQDELRDWPALLRYTTVGTLWYVWHFTYLLGANGISGEVVNLGFLVLASIGIGFVADRTRSIFAAAAFHIVGNILMTSIVFRTLIPASNARMTIVLICVAIWLVMLRIWAIRDKRIRAAAGG